MSAARKRYALIFVKELRKEDVPEIIGPCLPHFQRALREIEARTDDKDRKDGRLSGSLSASFFCDDKEEEPSGRIVYTVEGTEIRVIAAHPDHDEAYKRARKRAAKYL